MHPIIPPNPPIQPELENIELVNDGWVKKYVLTYRLPDGSAFPYESVSRKSPATYEHELRRLVSKPQTPDAVCIVPRTAHRELVLIKEFRYPLNSWCIAFPTGLIEEGESLEETVRRELHEETGYEIAEVPGKPIIHPLSQPGYSSSGMSEESVQVIYTRVKDNPRQAEPESMEFIEIFTLPLAELPRFLATNTTPIETRCQLVLEAFAGVHG